MWLVSRRSHPTHTVKESTSDVSGTTEGGKTLFVLKGNVHRSGEDETGFGVGCEWYLVPHGVPLAAFECVVQIIVVFEGGGRVEKDVFDRFLEGADTRWDGAAEKSLGMSGNAPGRQLPGGCGRFAVRQGRMGH